MDLGWTCAACRQNETGCDARVARHRDFLRPGPDWLDYDDDGPGQLLALRGRAGLPRWLGVLGAIAFAEQAIETITIFGSTGFTQPGGAMNMQLGAGLTLAWLLGFAIWGGLRGRFENSNA